MRALINYANAPFRRSRRNNSRTGAQLGNFDKVISYGPKHVDAAFFERNRRILTQLRGNGYWLWKPYFIERSLELLKEGDYLFYCDAGADFTGPVDPLIHLCDRAGQDVIPFELAHIEKHWTKRDAFVLMDCDRPECADSRQRLASFILFRKSDFSMDFARDFLARGQDERLITDLENQMGLPNYPGFQDHRHDQSIFSLLTKKYGLEGFRDPSQFGDPQKEEYPNSPYPTLISHHKGASFGDRVRLTAWKALKMIEQRLDKTLRP